MNGVVAIAAFVVQYGLPALQQIVALVHQTTPPTQAQWDAVFALANKSYEDYVKAPPVTAPAPNPTAGLT